MPTASSPKVVEWNINDNFCGEWYIEEEIDIMNRVTKIVFKENGGVYNIFPMYGVPIIKYVYNENSIIEYYFDINGFLMKYVETEAPFARVYYYDKNNVLVKCQVQYYHGRKNCMSIDDIADKSKIKVKSDEFSAYVNYYLYSYNKNNFKFPRRKKYIFKQELLELVYDKKLIDSFKYKCED